VLDGLEDTKIEKEMSLGKLTVQLENATTLLLEMPKQPTLTRRFAQMQEEHDRLEATLTNLQTQIEEERERAATAENTFRQTQSALARLSKAHARNAPEVYDLRSRLHQMLKRSVADIRFYPAHSTQADEFHGKIAVRFHSSPHSRTFDVERGQATCWTETSGERGQRPMVYSKEARRRAVEERTPRGHRQ
jgi:hypothetical protein